VTTPMASAQPPQHRRRWPRVLMWVSIGLAALLVVVGTGGYLLYRHFFNQIATAPIVVPPKDVPKKVVANAENFLLMGSDTRSFKGGSSFGSEVTGARSDTTILLHLSAGNRKATLVSIPRDSYVHIPACIIGPHGQKSQPTVGKFNEAFSIGATAGNKYAPSCTIATVEKLTHVHIDHYAVINFGGFEHVVDALGGVKMCVAHPLVDPIVHTSFGWHGSGLNLPAGKSVEIDGTQALALMRARYNLDGGGDLPRIKRQQEFLGAVARKAFSTGLLLDPIKLLKVINAATKSLQTDGFGLHDMIRLASAIHDVGPGGIQILTVPLDTTLPPGVPTADVAWDPTKSAQLWKAIRDDKPIPGTVTAKVHLTVPPNQINVAVMNATGKKGLAHTVATKLTAQGYNVVTVGNAKTQTRATTLVEYGSDRVQSSQTVAAAVPGSVRAQNLAVGSPVTIVLGANYASVVPVKISTPNSSIDVTTADKEGCLS
jgi:LCP family protein required for cell wall assembly